MVKTEVKQEEKAAWLLEKLDLAEDKIKLYVNANKDSFWVNRIKKILSSPLKIVRVSLYKLGFYKKADVSVKMFWEKDIILPLWDENVLIAYYSGSFGLVELPLVRFLIKNIHKGDVFYDIGSSFGLYTFLGEELEADVYSFEPNSHTVKYIRTNANLNTKVEAVALSNTSGELTFHDSFLSNKSGMSSLFPDIAAGTSAGVYKTISVPSITLDEYIVSHKIPKIIKMDVMNADYLVLEGGRKLFTENSPVLALRIYNTPLAAERTKMSLDLLERYGYSSYMIEKDGGIKPFKIQVNNLKFASTFIFKKS